MLNSETPKYSLPIVCQLWSGFEKDIWRGDSTGRKPTTLCRLWLTITTSKQLWIGYGLFGCLEATTGTRDNIFSPPFSPNPDPLDSRDFVVSQWWLQWLRLDFRSHIPC